MANKKAATKKAATKSAVTRQSKDISTAKTTAAKKTVGKKVAAKKTPAKALTKRGHSAKTTASDKKQPAAKASTKQAAPTGKRTVRKAAGAKPARAYSPSVARRVQEELHSMHEGTLRSGRSGRKVTNPKQAIAIALSEARRHGAKMPPDPRS